MMLTDVDSFAGRDAESAIGIGIEMEQVRDRQRAAIWVRVVGLMLKSGRYLSGFGVVVF